VEQRAGIIKDEKSIIRWAKQDLANVPADNHWLSPGEAFVLKKLRFPKRRNDWRLGRWTVKNLLFNFPQIAPKIKHFSDIEILAAADGAPEVFLLRQPVPFSISISHSNSVGFATVNLQNNAVGCDIEIIETRNPAFVKDYFTAAEIAQVNETAAVDRDRVITLIWSAKESALKALREGLRLDTRRLEVQCHARSTPQNWQPLTIAYQKAGRIFSGWWQRYEDFVLTIVKS